jgi:hypothetical protein
MKFFLAISFFVCQLHFAHAAQQVRICMLPLFYESVVPITEDTILKVCEIRVVDDRNADLKKLIYSINRIDGTFNKKLVRARIDSVDGKTIYFDKTGGVKFGESEFRMTSNSFEMFRFYLYKLYCH